MNTGLSDLVVWITGASGGIGLALADVFAGEGCRLVLHANRNVEPLEGWARSRGKSEHVAIERADISDPAAVEELVGRARARFGRLDVCVASAGVWPPEALPFHEMPAGRVRQVLDVNLLGAAWSARAFLRGLAADGPRPDGRGASLCFIGSTAGRFGEAGHAEYATSKAGLYGLVRTLKNEIVRLDPYGRVNMVEPGWTLTSMATEALEQPGTVERVLATTPMQQLARPEDIARVVMSLCAPGLSRHITGEVLTVAGGMEGRLLWGPGEIDIGRVQSRLERE